MGLITKRSTMTFFSDGNSHLSHRVRIVLAEKGVTVDIVEVTEDNVPEDLAELNPYNTLPTLVDRELVLYESKIMMEYLDERFPHPPLLPVYPVSRGYSRQFIWRMERDWGVMIDTILSSKDEKSKEKARKELLDGLMSIAPAFNEKPYFLSDEFTLVDCCLAPIFWRLPQLGIEIPNTKQTKSMLSYMEDMFRRPSFRASLSEQEREMREPQATSKKK